MAEDSKVVSLADARRSRDMDHAREAARAKQQAAWQGRRPTLAEIMDGAPPPSAA